MKAIKRQTRFRQKLESGELRSTTFVRCPDCQQMVHVLNATTHMCEQERCSLPHSVVSKILGKPLSRIYAEDDKQALKIQADLNRRSLSCGWICPLVTLPFMYCFTAFGRITQGAAMQPDLPPERTPSESESSDDEDGDPAALAARGREEEKAATKMQAQVRGWSARNAVADQEEERQDKEDAAIFVQSVWRGRAGRGAVRRLADARMATLQRDSNAAATKIQARVRGQNGYTAGEGVRKTRAAIRLQGIFRSKKSRRFIMAVMDVVRLTKNLPHDQRLQLFEVLADAPMERRQKMHADMLNMSASEQAAFVGKLLSEKRFVEERAARKIQRMHKQRAGRAFMQMVLNVVRLTKHLPKEQRKLLAATMTGVSAAEGQQMSTAMGRMSAEQRTAYAQYLRDEEGEEEKEEAADEVTAVQEGELKRASQWGR